MDFLGGMSEMSEGSEIKDGAGSEISQESLDKFDKIMGDDKIESKQLEEAPNLTPVEAEDKFSKLFDEDFASKSEMPNSFVNTEKSEKSSENATEQLESRELTDEEKCQKVQDFIDGKVEFEEVKEIFADYYASAVKSNRPWAWNEDIPSGENLTGGQRKAIREYAREKGLVRTVPTYEKDGKTYADFSLYKVIECVLGKEDWNKTDKEQFDKCNEMLKRTIENNPELAKRFTQEQLEQISKGETPLGYTWHHSEKDGTMQLVPYGVHNSTNHCGGRSEGNWADSPRQ